MQTIENEKLKLENELLQKQVNHLKEKLCGLICSTKTVKIEPIDVVFHKPEPTVTVARTPAGYVKVGDVVCYDRCNSLMRFGTVYGFQDDGRLKLHRAYTVKIGDDNKQTIYDMLDVNIEPWRVCKII